MDRTGQQFGNYCLVRLLGRGGYADTYLAEHVHLRTSGAVKLLSLELSQENRERFYQESRTIANLNHPNIIRMLDFGSVADVPYLVMDYAARGTLRQLHPRGTPIPIATIVLYVQQIAAALHYAHNQGIVHRDVKPENMLLNADDVLLLSDFGSAFLQNAQNKHDVAGTITYMAPEQIAGRPCPASDQYALAAVIYEWLCGLPPFLGGQVEVAMQHERSKPPDLLQRVPSLPSSVEEVISIALAKEPQQRFGSILAFATALEQAMRDAPSPLPTDETQQAILKNAAADRPASPQQRSGKREGQNQATLNRSSSIVPQEQDALRPAQKAEHIQGDQSADSTQRDGSLRVSASKPLAAGTRAPILAPLLSRPASPRVIGTTLALVALLVIGSIFSLIFVVYLPNQRHIQATATVASYTTATAQSRVITQATAQARSTATTRQTFYVQATRGRPALDESLQAANASRWDEATYSDGHGKTIGSCGFANDSYHSKAQAGYFIRCVAEASTFANLAYQAQITLLAGHTGGLLVRADASGSGYYFCISSDGSYALQKVAVDRHGNSVNTVLVSGKSAAIKTGRPNLLTLIASGSNLSLYINSQYVDQASDATYKAGHIGIYADGDTVDAEVAARSVRAWKV